MPQYAESYHAVLYGPIANLAKWPCEPVAIGHGTSINSEISLKFI